MTEIAEAIRLDPDDDLRRVIQQIVDRPVDRIDKLLPWNHDGIRARLDQRRAT